MNTNFRPVSGAEGGFHSGNHTRVLGNLSVRAHMEEFRVISLCPGWNERCVDVFPEIRRVVYDEDPIFPTIRYISAPSSPEFLMVWNRCSGSFITRFFGAFKPTPLKHWENAGKTCKWNDYPEKSTSRSDPTLKRGIHPGRMPTSFEGPFGL